ncbi:hypothetical protein [Flavisolibacter tropicus]|uniref:Uncharacterized protein n=1 Tax=Flavisolibacter tropicus TaxID=1492898 RepID=A0A172TXC6_9BACT|nr:hypothetical protein [Flavisolibacter tropicus]ANE51387.1 hypothetical protein SY85_13595 [Flavisolibacter tropicus]
MFSLLFFFFVAFILIMGYAIVTLVRRKKKAHMPINDRGLINRNESRNATRSFSQNTFREERGNTIQGNILPTDSKRPDSNSRDQDQPEVR